MSFLGGKNSLYFLEISSLLSTTFCINMVINYTSQDNVLRSSRVITSNDLIKTWTMYITKELYRHKKLLQIYFKKNDDFCNHRKK